MVPEIKHELCVIDGIVYRGSRIVVPLALQKRVVELSHRGHQGMSKAKILLRTFCWFPGMDKAVENKVRECLPCQAVQPASNEQPIKPSELPSGPWQYVEMDFQGPYPNGDYIFIMIDPTLWAECWSRNTQVQILMIAKLAAPSSTILKSSFENITCQRDLEWNLKDLLEHSVGMLEHLAQIFVSCFQTSAFGIWTRNLEVRGTHEPFWL